MIIDKYVEVDVEVELKPKEIFRNLSSQEKEELLELLLGEMPSNKDYYLERLFIGKKDYQILTDKKVWDKLIYHILYSDSTLKNYIIEELSYNP